MHQYRLLPFVLLVINLVHVPISFCQPQYNVCDEPYRCGNIEFQYPFWEGTNRPKYCGHPDFEITCQDDLIPKITVSSIAYRILQSPDTGEKTFRLARDDIYTNYCAANDWDEAVFSPAMFSYTDTQNLTILYNCPDLSSRSQNLSRFACTDRNNGHTINYFILSNAFQSISNPPDDLKSCTHNITVPLSREFTNVVGTGALAVALASGFQLGYKADNDDCDDCRISGLGTPKQRLITGLSAGAASLVMIGIVIYCLAQRFSCSEVVFNWRSDKGSNKLVNEFMKNYGSLAPRLYSYEEIRKVTNSFADKLGHGGYGCVYRGTLSDGREVAVKVLDDNKGNGQDFINEVAAISRTSHVNVVALLGFCYNRSKRALIYEFMPNGSLDKVIGWKDSAHLRWKLLYEIAMGIARGLEYLHRGCNTRMVHLDIKPQNILLDADFHPKISDFGLAKLYKSKESVLSTIGGARGTVGYIAPEMVLPNFGGVSHKSDVYSYGMMVLEMVGLTRKPEADSRRSSEAYFPDWIHERVQLGGEFLLNGVANEEEKENAMKMIYVGLWCIQQNPLERPSMTKVVEMLDGSLHSLQIPPNPHDQQL